MATGTQTSAVTLLGIRHHGPGSARSALRALEALRPGVLLVEAPEDAEEALQWMTNPALRPPVALLLHDAAEPRFSAFYPFAEFSPEWVAIRWAQENLIPVRLIDLPMRHRLALEKEEEAARRAEAERRAAEAQEEAAAEVEGEKANAPEQAPPEEARFFEVREDPMQALAEAAGYEDTERWWDELVEHQPGDLEMFAAVGEAMGALRGEFGDGYVGKWEDLREAWMRQGIRAAQKDGFERIAVLCGAWHTPALAQLPPAKADKELLKNLPKTKVASTWAPWTYPRLAQESGYGAGVPSPGWYEHLWAATGANWDARRTAAQWLARVAALLRQKDFEVSSGHLIEAVRLVEALASLRGRAMPGLAELDEAITSVLLFGDPLPLRLIYQELVIGRAMGSVPEEAPKVPLQVDFEQQAKRLRLKITADYQDVEYDLRKELDLARSEFLHRLRLLGVPWGDPREAARGRGTFKEAWRLQWQPELAVRLITAAVWGTTVEAAAVAFVRDRAEKAADLPALTSLVGDVLTANLTACIPPLVRALENRAALAADAGQMMQALPALAEAARYGNVRGTDLRSLDHVIEGLARRICAGLSPACSSLNDDAAQEMLQRIVGTDAALLLVERADLLREWRDQLAAVMGRADLHPLLAGRLCRLLLDAGALDVEQAARQLGLATSRANDPVAVAYWIEGFLGNSGQILLLNEPLWALVDQWLCGLGPEQFDDVLPMVRRTFSNFPGPERRQLGERVKNSAAGHAPRPAAAAQAAIDPTRADEAIPLLRALLTNPSAGGAP